MSPDPFSPLTVQGNSTPTLGTVTRAGTVLTYKPGKLFAGTDNFTYTISDGFGGQDTGTIAIVNPFLAYDGNYEALVGDDDGLVTAKVSGGGLLTGKIKLGAKSYVLKGLLGFNGAFTQVIKRKGLADLVILLTFASPGSITGTVAGTANEQFTIAQNAILATAVPAPAVAGKYTLLLEPDAMTIPAPLNAHGWATALLTANGSFSMIGVTPDGQPLVLKGRMRADTSVTLFLSAPAPKSAFVGSFTFADNPESDFSGALRWTRGPITKGIFLGAINTIFAIRGCQFRPPLKGVRTLAYSDLINATGQLNLTGGSLAPDITRIFDISTADKAVLAIGQANPELVKITRIDRVLGRIEGTFKHPALDPKAAPVKFRGVQLQTAAGGTGPNKAAGTFTIPTGTGTATFTPQ